MKLVFIGIFFIMIAIIFIVAGSKNEPKIPLADKSKIKYICLDDVIYVNIYDTAYVVKFNKDGHIEKCY